jgi:hypothetical protein
MMLTTSVTTITWVIVTFLTPPEPAAKLREFYQRVRPAAVGWRGVAGLERQAAKQNLLWSAADWIAGCGLIYTTLFGIGYVIFGRAVRGISLLMVGACCALFIFWDLRRRGWDVLSGGG